MYTRPLPRRKPKTAAEIREEAAAKLKEDREKSKTAAEAKFRGTNTPPVNMPGPSQAGKRRGSIPTPTTPAGQASAAQQTNAGTSQDTPIDVPDDADVPAMGQAEIAFFKAMENRLTAAAKESARESAEGVASLLQRNIARIDANAKNIQELKDRDKDFETRLLEKIDERDKAGEKRMEERLSAIVDTKIARALATSAAAPAPAGRREKEYDFCRRSLRLWPVKGEDYNIGVEDFLVNKLLFDRSEVRGLGPYIVKPVPSRAGTPTEHIVLVTFESKEVRDQVKSHGKNLASANGAGMNIHVPGYLLDNLHALNAVGFSIKEKHKNVRRAVKFDDQRMDLYMDIFIGGEWKRVTASEAREVAADIPAKKGGLKLSKSDLSSLVRGEPVAGLTVVEVPPDN